jgi:hypothetical protein
MQTVGLHQLSGKLVGFRPSRNLIATLELPSGAVEYAGVQVRDDGTFYLTKGLLPEKYIVHLAGATTVADLTAGDVDGLLIEPLKAGK